MNMAKKLLQLKQDFDDVYAAGKSVGGGGGDYDQGYEDGKNSVVDYAKLCRNIQFADINVFGKNEIVFELDKATNLNKMFAVEQENKTVEHITVNCPNKITGFSYFCTSDRLGDYKLKRVTLNLDTAEAENTDSCFHRLNALEVIDGTPIDLSSCTTQTRMYYLNNLKEIRFKGSIKTTLRLDESSMLSDESVQSIINCLADLTGGTAQTLQFHATVGAKLTDTQKATITAKNWELVY